MPKRALARRARSSLLPLLGVDLSVDALSHLETLDGGHVIAIFAPRFCCTAALDGTHHLHLVETGAAAIGITPSGTVIAEDGRNLQGWPSHGRGRLPGAACLAARHAAQPARRAFSPNPLRSLSHRNYASDVDGRCTPKPTVWRFGGRPATSLRPLYGELRSPRSSAGGGRKIWPALRSATSA
jgi:hypothetical protein